MTAQDIYEAIKDALDYVGVGFHGMDKVNVTIDGNELYLVANGRTAVIAVPQRGE